MPDAIEKAKKGQFALAEYRYGRDRLRLVRVWQAGRDGRVRKVVQPHKFGVDDRPSTDNAERDFGAVHVIPDDMTDALVALVNSPTGKLEWDDIGQARKDIMAAQKAHASKQSGVKVSSRTRTTKTEGKVTLKPGKDVAKAEEAKESSGKKRRSTASSKPTSGKKGGKPTKVNIKVG